MCGAGFSGSAPQRYKRTAWRCYCRPLVPVEEFPFAYPKLPLGASPPLILLVRLDTDGGSGHRSPHERHHDGLGTGLHFDGDSLLPAGHLPGGRHLLRAQEEVLPAQRRLQQPDVRHRAGHLRRVHQVTDLLSVLLGLRGSSCNPPLAPQARIILGSAVGPTEWWCFCLFVCVRVCVRSTLPCIGSPRIRCWPGGSGSSASISCTTVRPTCVLSPRGVLSNEGARYPCIDTGDGGTGRVPSVLARAEHHLVRARGGTSWSSWWRSAFPSCSASYSRGVRHVASLVGGVQPDDGAASVALPAAVLLAAVLAAGALH